LQEGSSDPRSDRTEPTAEKMLLDIMTFSCTHRADCTSLTVKNIPLISDATLDEKSLTGLFSDQLSYSIISHRVRFHKEEIIFKYKESKKSISI